MLVDEVRDAIDSEYRRWVNQNQLDIAKRNEKWLKKSQRDSGVRSSESCSPLRRFKKRDRKKTKPSRKAPSQFYDENPEHYVSMYELRRDLKTACADLQSIRSLEVLAMRFGMGPYEEHTLEKIASIIGVTAERVRQIEAKALRDLRRWPMSSILIPHLPFDNRLPHQVLS